MKDERVSYTPINKHLMAIRDKGSYISIEPNIFEAVKAECIAMAKGALSRYLPYKRVWFDSDRLPDLYAWMQAFSSDNSPAVITFDSRLEAQLSGIDFSKPFDKAEAEAIRSEFRVKEHKRANVDADLIIQGELGELPEQQP